MLLRKTLIHFFFLLPLFSLAQSDTTQKIKVDTSVFKVVEVLPVFPGGDEAIFKYLGKNVKYPKEAKKNGIHGKVMVTFTITKEGKVNDVKVTKGLGYGCDEEALRVIRNMPDWTPGKQNNRDVAVQYTLPVLFDKGDPYYFAR